MFWCQWHVYGFWAEYSSGLFIHWVWRTRCVKVGKVFVSLSPMSYQSDFGCHIRLSLVEIFWHMAVTCVRMTLVTINVTRGCRLSATWQSWCTLLELTYSMEGCSCTCIYATCRHIIGIWAYVTRVYNIYDTCMPRTCTLTPGPFILRRNPVEYDMPANCTALGT